MVRSLSWSRAPDRSVIFFGLLATALFVIEQLNGRNWMNDFRVYWGAADALIHGSPVYGVAHGLGSGVFKYAPFMALLFVPLALLPYPIAAAVQFAAIVAAFLYALVKSDALVRSYLLKGRSVAHAPLFITGVVVVVHLHRELHLGNINMLLLAALLLAIERMLQGRGILAGILFGVVIIAKPHFLVLVPWLLLRGRIKESSALLAAIGACIFLPSLLFGLAENSTLHKEWFAQMASHNAALIYSGGEAHEAVNTVYSFLHRAVLGRIGIQASSTEAYVILGVIAASFGVLVLRNMRREQQGTLNKPSALLFEVLVLIALVPSITLTDTEHFLFALPLIAYLVHHLVPHAVPRWSAWVLVPVLFAYGGNWEDALGPLADRMIHYGVLGIGNAALIGLCVWLYLRSSRVSGEGPKAQPG